MALVGVFGPLFYIALTIVIGWLWRGYDPVRQTQSELGAIDSPYGDLMNMAGFMAMGITILFFAVAYHLLLRRSVAKSLATVLMVGAGLGMVAVGFFPCDAGCVDVTRTGELHSLFSMPGAIGLPAAAMFSSRAFWSDGRFRTSWQVGSFWLGLVALATGPIIAAEWLDGANGGLQRAAMWVPLLWVTLVSWKLRSVPPILQDQPDS